MNKVLWISLIGSSLVIFGLMLLWFVMDILVRLSTISFKKKHEIDAPILDDERTLDLECKQKAAAASIAVAMALSNTSFLSTLPENNQRFSAWQIGHRNQNIYNRLDTSFKGRQNK